jgi:excisionase family DNA binding protein
MNKKEAADYLGISIRTLQRYTAQGKIGARISRGKTGMVTDYDDEEVRRFKKELENNQGYIRPTVVRETEHVSEQKATLPAVDDVQKSVMEDFFKMILELWQTRNNSVALLGNNANMYSSPAVPIADKIMLTIPEASLLTSLSPTYLINAIHEGSLKAKMIGDECRVKREDLDQYIKQL